MNNQPFSRIQTACLEGRAHSVRYRQQQLHSLHKALKGAEQAIRSAILADTGHSDHEITLEYSFALKELYTHYLSLNLGEELKSQRLLENLKAVAPIGIIYVFPANQNLFYSVISILTAGLAAGNCVILELSTNLMQVSQLLRELLPAALDADTFAISSSKPSSEFLKNCLVISQTEDEQPQLVSGATGLQSAGSAKTVAIVDRSADVQAAALTIGSARVGFNGRSAYRPDIVLVNEFVADDFLFHLTQGITSPVLERNPLKVRSRPKAIDDAHGRTIKEIEKSGALKVIVSGASGSVVEINRSKGPFDSRVQGRVVLVCRTTSLDDAIDMCNGFASTLEASYIFAGPPEANYVSRFLDARLSCINHIPVELLVGPFNPSHPHVAPSPSPRYTLDLFQTPRPRVANLSNLSKLNQEATRSRSAKELEAWSRSVSEAKLPEIKQGDGKAVGFFDQALMVVGGSILFFIAGTSFVLFRYRR